MSDSLAQKLVLHLPLCGDATAETTESCRFVNHNVAIGESYASFNGTDSYLEVPSNVNLHLGDEDFSIAAQIWTAEKLDGVIGDIVSKFDPIKRRGLNLSVKHHAGAVSS